jgi:acetylglutamate kinase
MIQTQKIKDSDSLEELPVELQKEKYEQLRDGIVLIKYGGNAMMDDALRLSVMHDIAQLQQLGMHPVVVHGGGPVIRHMLEQAGIKTRFVGGQRKTPARAMPFVEMALKGRVNGELVSMLNSAGARGIGLSGKDGSMVLARKKKMKVEEKGKSKKIDLGRVGEIVQIDPSLIFQLLREGYVPVLAPLASDKKHRDFNINADSFAGHMAAALGARAHVALTDIDGLMMDPKLPETLIRSLKASKALSLFHSVIKGGMIPKVESCLIALQGKVGASHIINGHEPHSLLKALLGKEPIGTQILPD